MGCRPRNPHGALTPANAACTLQDEDEMEFQLRRQEMITVQRSEAHKIRQLLQQEHETEPLQDSNTSHTLDDSPKQVSCFLMRRLQL